MLCKCVTKCWYGERLWEIGDILDHDGDEVPTHFVEDGTDIERASTARAATAKKAVVVKKVAPKGAASKPKETGRNKALSGKPTALSDL